MNNYKQFFTIVKYRDLFTMPLNYQTFGQSLSEERKRLGLKVNELAEIGGVKPGSQYLYEKGDRLPNADYLDRIISYGVNARSLLPSLASQESFTLEAVLVAVAKADSVLEGERLNLIKEMLQCGSAPSSSELKSSDNA